MGSTIIGGAPASSFGYGLITIAEMKVFPGFSSLPVTMDAILEALIEAATLDFEEYWDNYGVQRAVSNERHTYSEIRRDFPRADKIQLEKYPIVTASGVLVTDPAGNAIAATDFWIQPDLGQLITVGGWAIPQDANGFETYWQCSYVGGRVANTAAVPANIKHACKMWVASLYKRPDRDLVSKSVGDLSLTFAKGPSEELPELIKRMISGWKKRSL